MMLLGLIPIGLAAVMFLSGSRLPIPRLAFGGLFFLICPLMHIGMMYFMHKGMHHGKSENNDGQKAAPNCH